VCLGFEFLLLQATKDEEVDRIDGEAENSKGCRCSADELNIGTWGHEVLGLRDDCEKSKVICSRKDANPLRELILC
jgi:hypothetical protein